MCSHLLIRFVRFVTVSRFFGGLSVGRHRSCRDTYQPSIGLNSLRQCKAHSIQQSNVISFTLVALINGDDIQQFKCHKNDNYDDDDDDRTWKFSEYERAYKCQHEWMRLRVCGKIDWTTTKERKVEKTGHEMMEWKWKMTENKNENGSRRSIIIINWHSLLMPTDTRPVCDGENE